LDGNDWSCVQDRSEQTHKTSGTLNDVLHPEGEAEFTVPRFDNPVALLSDAAGTVTLEEEEEEEEIANACSRLRLKAPSNEASMNDAGQSTVL
jgi:hypothetical protein